MCVVYVLSLYSETCLSLYLCVWLLENSVAYIVFFFNGPATPEIYTLSLHDALPISSSTVPRFRSKPQSARSHLRKLCLCPKDRKSTRLNSSHRCISYAVFCLKKKKQDPR